MAEGIEPMRCLSVLGIAMGIWGVVADGAAACGICLTSPERTVSDRLISDDVLVLARPDAEDRFRFGIQTALRGDPASAPAPGLLVPSSLRARFNVNDDLVAVMSYGPAEPETDAGPARPAQWRGAASTAPAPKVWSLLMLASPEELALIEDIVTRAPGWGVPGPQEGPAPRFEFFEDLLESPDADLRRIAVRELRKWPYARLRTVDASIPLPELATAVQDLFGIPDAPLYIQLIGLNDEPDAAAYIARAARQALSVAPNSALQDRTAAWAMALIEVEGEAGIETVAEALLTPAGLSPEARRIGIGAISTLAGVRPELRGLASEVLSELALGRPETLADVTAVLRGWEDWRLQQAAETRLAEADLMGAEAFALRHYVAAARIAQ